MKDKFIPKNKIHTKTKNDYGEFETIAMNLRHDDKTSSNDKTCFEKYVEGAITLEECLSKFKRNNKIQCHINLDLFRRWLMSLGWVKAD